MFVKKLDLKTGHVSDKEGLLLHNPETPYIIEGITGQKFDFSGTELDAVQLAPLNDEFVYPISSSIINDLSGYEKTYFMNKSVYVGFTMKTDVVFRIRAYASKNYLGLPAGANSCSEIIIFGSGYNKNELSRELSDYLYEKLNNARLKDKITMSKCKSLVSISPYKSVTSSSSFSP